MLVLLYKILFTIFGAPAMFLNPKSRAGAKVKLGFYPFKNSEKTLWVHAVSVGEVLALVDFIKKLEGYDVVLTVSTPQAYALADNKLKDACKEITYFPYDSPFCVLRAIDAINPELVLIMETEIWPSFIDELHNRKIPTIIINGRISERTFKSYKLTKFFFAPIMSKFTSILAQSEADAQRFLGIGAKASGVKVMGNIKFDIKRPNSIEFDLKIGNSPLFVAGSTHKGEDKIVLDAYLEAKKSCPKLKFLIAPRHLERVEEIESIFKEVGVSYELRSLQKTFEHTDVMILNTTGELALSYSFASVAFIGGSYDKTGGHNPLEASIWAKPVLSGPCIKNFRQVYAQLCENSCAKIIQEPRHLGSELEKLLANQSVLEEISQNCENVFEKNSGATQYLLNLLKNWKDYNCGRKN